MQFLSALVKRTWHQRIEGPIYKVATVNKNGAANRRNRRVAGLPKHKIEA
jgi:hypothetical protein